MLDSPGLVVPPRLGLVSFSIHRKLPSNELGRFLMSHFIFLLLLKEKIIVTVTMLLERK